MSCKGCSGAVERALKKAKENNENGEFPAFLYYSNIHIHLSGIADYHVNFDKKEVIVKGTISLEKAAATIEKTGKTVGVSLSLDPPPIDELFSTDFFATDRRIEMMYNY